MIYILLFFLGHWYLSLFFQSFFCHRYSAHEMFTMSKPVEKVFFILSFLFQGSNYLSAYGYGRLHRLHHAYADTEKDPHSPKYSSNLFTMMWDTKKEYAIQNQRKVELDAKFTKNLPQWDSFDKFASSNFMRVAWGTLYTLFYIQFVPEGHWWMFLLLPIHFLMSPVHGAIINWFAHKVGYRNFKLNNTSTNFLPVDFLMWGESYHNNHHAHAKDPNFGHRWFEIDPLYVAIRVLAFFRVIKLAR